MNKTCLYNSSRKLRLTNLTPVIARITASLLILLNSLPPANAQSSTKDGTKNSTDDSIVGIYVGTTKVARVHRTAVIVNGQPGLVVEKVNAKGLRLERMLAWADKIEIAIDHQGLGFLDTWELYANQTHVKLSAPANGRFQNMEVDVISEGKNVAMLFHRNDAGDFHFVGKEMTPAAVFFEEARDAGEAVSAKHSANSDEHDAIDVKGRVELHHRENITQKINLAMQMGDPKSPCTEDFQQHGNLIKGIQNVLLSDTRATPPSGPKIPPTTYLACLHENGFDAEADFIDSRFFATALSPQGLTNSSWGMSCQTCKTVSATGVCSGSMKTGAFQPSATNGKPLLSFVHSASCDGASCSDTTPQQFARTFMHEMLHAASLNSERTLNAISDCCAPENAQEPNCRALEHISAVRKRNEVYQMLFNQLPTEVRTEVGSQCALIKSADDSPCPDHYLAQLAEEHQTIITQHSSETCKNESAPGCQKILDKAQATVFAQTVTAQCKNASNGKMLSTCMRASSELAAIVAPASLTSETTKTPDKINLIDFSAAQKLIQPLKAKYQQTTGQMQNSAALAGQTGSANLANIQSSGGGTTFATQGPQMASYSPSYTANSERAAALMANTLGKESSLLDSFVSSASRMASVLLGSATAQASALTLADPLASHANSHAVAAAVKVQNAANNDSEAASAAILKKLLTRKNSAAGVPVRLAPGTQAQSQTPIDPVVRKQFIEQMTSLKKGRLHEALETKAVQDELARYRIGVIDGKGVRHDHTEEPNNWLMFDPATDSLNFIDSGDKH